MATKDNRTGQGARQTYAAVSVTAGDETVGRGELIATQGRSPVCFRLIGCVKRWDRRDPEVRRGEHIKAGQERGCRGRRKRGERNKGGKETQAKGRDGERKRGNGLK